MFKIFCVRMKFVTVLLCSLASVLFVQATETTTIVPTQDRDTQLQTHLSQVPDVDAQNYYNKNVNHAFRLFRPDLETDDEKLKEKYGIEFLPNLIAKQQLPTFRYNIAIPNPRTKRDAGAIRFDEPSPKSFFGLGGHSSSQAGAQAQSQTNTLSLNFGPIGATFSSSNAASHANANANSGGGFGGGHSGAVAQAAAGANSGSYGGGPFGGGGISHATAQASAGASAHGLVPPQPFGHYGGYPVQGYGPPGPGHFPGGHGGGGHYGGHYHEEGYYGGGGGPYGGGHYGGGHYGGGHYGGSGHRPYNGYGHHPNHYGPQFHQNYPAGGLYGGGPAGHYPDAYDGYGRSGKVSKTNGKD